MFSLNWENIKQKQEFYKYEPIIFQLIENTLWVWFLTSDYLWKFNLKLK